MFIQIECKVNITLFQPYNHIKLTKQSYSVIGMKEVLCLPYIILI